MDNTESVTVQNNKTITSRNLKVMIVQEEDGTYIASVPSLTYCMTYGDTLEEAMFNIREAAEGVLGVMVDEGWDIPDDSNVIEYSMNLPLNELQSA